jgi:hypothetical protein
MAPAPGARKGQLAKHPPPAFRRLGKAVACRRSSRDEEGDVTEQVGGKPTLYVCHGDRGGPSFHPCRRAQEELQRAGIEYEKVVAGHGSPIPFLRKGSREQLREATGDTKLPTLKLADGTVIHHSRAIFRWIAAQRGGA